LKIALTDPKYRPATWVNIGHIICHELTGFNIVMMYSNSIFHQLNDGKQSFLSPRQGTYLTGIINIFAAIVATQGVKHIGRRTLLIWGHLAMTSFHILIAWFSSRPGNENVMLVMIMLFIFAYQTTSGPVAWIYFAETTIDAALGLCLFVLWFTVFVLSLVCPVLMAPTSIGPTNMFYLFAGLTSIGFFYCIAFIKETQGLSDKAKKMLFYPKRLKILERVERDGERSI
jgi:hypothetical protein